MTAFVRLSPAKHLRLVVIYPGVGYGTQQYVLDRMQGRVLPGMQEKVLIAVAPQSNTPWTELISEIHQYINREGLTVTPSALIGWSGGAKGVANAVANGHDFPTVMLADPSPVEQAFSGPNTRVWYNPSNWKGSLAHLGPRQAEYAQLLGANAVLVQLDHNEILDEVIGRAIQENKPLIPLPFVLGAPVALAILIIAYRRLRE